MPRANLPPRTRAASRRGPFTDLCGGRRAGPCAGLLAGLLCAACNEAGAPLDNAPPDQGAAADLAAPPDEGAPPDLARGDGPPDAAEPGGWRWVYPRPHGDHAIRLLKVGDTLFELTQAWTLYESGDGGATWSERSRSSLGLDSQRFIWRPWDAAADPTGAVWYAVGDNGAIAKSSDGGRSFTNVRPMNLFQTLFAVAAPSATDVLVAGDRELWRSSDGGKSWSQQPGSYRAIWAEGRDVLLGTDRGAILRSTDGGATFAQKSSGLGAGVRAFAAAGAERWAAGPFGTLLRSSDSGETWSKETPPSGTKDLYGVAIAGADVYVTGAEGTLLRRRGGAYEALASGTREALTTIVARGAEVVAAGTYGNLLRAGGARVTPVTQGSSVAVTGLARLPSGVVVLSGTDGAVRRSSDGGKSFSRVTVSTAALWGAARGAASEVYVIGDAIYRSSDEGQSFTSLRSAGGGGLTDIWADDQGNVLAHGSGSQLTYISRDAGKTWRTANPNGGSGGGFVAGVWGDGRGVILTGGMNGVWRSADWGATFTQTYVGCTVQGLRGDGSGRVFGTCEDVVLRSTDNGQSFTATQLRSGALGNWHGVYAEGKRVFVAGPWGMIYASTDEGLSWRREESATSLTLWGLTGGAAGEVLAAAQNGLLIRR